MDENKRISLEELCTFINIKDLRTLGSTKGFPKPKFDTGTMMFDVEEIKTFFKIDNFDEPFITLPEAAEYVGLKQSQVQYLALKSFIPSYRLKQSKGSNFLFRKSELDTLRKPSLDGNVDFINYFHGITELRKVYKDFISLHLSNELSVKEYEVVCMYFFDRMTFKEISEKSDLTPTRIGQLFNKSLTRIKTKMDELSSVNVNEMKRVIVHKDIQIEFLKQIIAKNSRHDLSTFDTEKFSELSNLLYGILKTPLTDLSLSVRALNLLHHSLNSYTVYDLLNNYGHEKKIILSKVRNLGKKSYEEISDMVDYLERDIEIKAKINTTSFFMNKPLSEVDKLIFDNVHERIKTLKLQSEQI